MLPWMRPQGGGISGFPSCVGPVSFSLGLKKSGGDKEIHGGRNDDENHDHGVGAAAYSALVTRVPAAVRGLGVRQFT